MDKYEIQRRVFRINAVLLLLSALALIAVIPRLIQEISPDGLPKVAAIATSVGMGIHLLLLAGFLIGIRLIRLKRRINREINLVAAIFLILLGFMISDGAFAYVDSLLYVSVGMFICVACDLSAGVVSIVGMVLLSKKRFKQ